MDSPRLVLGNDFAASLALIQAVRADLNEQVDLLSYKQKLEELLDNLRQQVKQHLAAADPQQADTAWLQNRAGITLGAVSEILWEAITTIDEQANDPSQDTVAVVQRALDIAARELTMAVEGLKPKSEGAA